MSQIIEVYRSYKSGFMWAHGQHFTNWICLERVCFKIDMIEARRIGREEKVLHAWCCGEKTMSVPRVKWERAIYNIKSLQFEVDGKLIEKCCYALFTPKGMFISR